MIYDGAVVDRYMGISQLINAIPKFRRGKVWVGMLSLASMQEKAL